MRRRNRGPAGQRGGDAPADRFSVFGYQPPGAAHTLFLFGITVGAVTSLGLRILPADLQPAASGAADARGSIARSHREEAFVNRDRDTRLAHQLRADATGHPRRATGYDTPTQ